MLSLTTSSPLGACDWYGRSWAEQAWTVSTTSTVAFVRMQSLKKLARAWGVHFGHCVERLQVHPLQCGAVRLSDTSNLEDCALGRSILGRCNRRAAELQGVQSMVSHRVMQPGAVQIQESGHDGTVQLLLVGSMLGGYSCCEASGNAT